MTKEIKELLADDLKNLTSNFDLVEHTNVVVVFPINHIWSVNFSKLSTDTYDYILFALLNKQTGYILRDVFLLKEFDKVEGGYKYSLQCNQLFKGNVQDASRLERFDKVSLQELIAFLNSQLTETQQWVLHHAIGRL